MTISENDPIFDARPLTPVERDTYVKGGDRGGHQEPLRAAITQDWLEVVARLNDREQRDVLPRVFLERVYDDCLRLLFGPLKQHLVIRVQQSPRN